MNDAKSPAGAQASTEVAYIESHWSQLQPHVREAILTLVEAGSKTASEREKSGSEAFDERRVAPVRQRRQ